MHITLMFMCKKKKKNYLEAALLHLNRNSNGHSNSMFIHPNERQLVVPESLRVAQYIMYIKRHKEGKEFFDEESFHL